ncbi:MAG: hypothetical protein R6U61_04890 [Thermoplasmata archaeon]
MEVITDVDLDGHWVEIACPRCEGSGVDPVVYSQHFEERTAVCRLCTGDKVIEGPAQGVLHDVTVEIDPVPVNEGYL